MTGQTNDADDLLHEIIHYLDTFGGKLPPQVTLKERQTRLLLDAGHARTRPVLVFHGAAIPIHSVPDSTGN